MSKLSPTLLALSLALALAATPAAAQQITTSAGVRTLPRTDGLKTEAQLRQALTSAEQILADVMRDVDALDRSRTSAAGDAAGLVDKVKKAGSDYESAKAALQSADQKYRTDLAAFQRRQAAQEADIREQRRQAAGIEALPSAQRDIKEVFRIDEWAAKIAKERAAIEADRTRLLADHAKVEADRAALEKQRVQTEASLKGSRSQVVGELSGTEEKRNRAYAQLRTTVRFVEAVLQQLNLVAVRKLPRSPLLDTATSKLRAWELKTPAR